MKKNEVMPLLLFYEKKDVPHLVIEVNNECNMRCTACYKKLTGGKKSVEMIKNEIDFALTQRKASNITLAGGEPTLHPGLPEIIRFISLRGRRPFMLTNGLALTDEKLRLYAEAGIVGFFLHIDSLQKRPHDKNIICEKDLNGLRTDLGTRIAAIGAFCFLEITLYQKNLGELPEVVLFVLKNEDYQGMLVTNYGNFQEMALRVNDGTSSGGNLKGLDQTVKNEEVEKILFEKLKMRPFFYFCSSHDTRERRWLYYYSLCFSKKNGEVEMLHLVPKAKGLIVFFRTFFKRRKDQTSMRGPKILRRPILACFLYAIFSFDFCIIKESFIFLRNYFSSRSRINCKVLVFQQGPNLRKDGAIEYCHNCPDATVRDGVLTPVCLVDLIDKKKRISL